MAAPESRGDASGIERRGGLEGRRLRRGLRSRPRRCGQPSPEVLRPRCETGRQIGLQSRRKSGGEPSGAASSRRIRYRWGSCFARPVRPRPERQGFSPGAAEERPAEQAREAPLVPEVTMLEAIRQALFEEMERDPTVVTLGEDIGVYGGAFKVTEGLLAKFGRERVIDTPISETAIVGAACGMSYLGLRPIAEMQFIDFIACCFNQVTNFVAKSHYLWGAPAPMVIRGPSGGGVHGGPFHSANPEMYFVHTPGLKVIYPSTPSDAKGLLKSAIRDNNPVLFFEHKYLYRRLKEEMPAGDHLVPIGKAAVRREGRDLTIISYAAMVHTAMEASVQLAKEGIEAEVIDLRTLLPLDKDTILTSVKKTNKLLIVHEDTRTGGIAGEIAAIVCENAFEDLDGPIERVTALDTPVPYSPPLEEYFLPNAKKVFDVAKELARY